MKQENTPHLITRRQFLRLALSTGGLLAAQASVIYLLINSAKGTSLDSMEAVNTPGSEAFKRFFDSAERDKILILSTTQFLSFKNISGDKMSYYPLANIRRLAQNSYEVSTINFNPGATTPETRNCTSLNHALDNAGRAFSGLRALHQRMDFAHLHIYFGKEFVSEMFKLQSFEKETFCNNLISGIYFSLGNLPILSGPISINETSQVDMQYDNSYPADNDRCRQLRIKLYFEIPTVKGNLRLGLIGHGREIYAVLTNSPGTHTLHDVSVLQTSNLEESLQNKTTFLFQTIAGYAVGFFDKLDGVEKPKIFA